MNIQDFANNSKYTKWYISIIEKAKLRASTRKDAKLLLKYVEGHHVIPKSIWKSQDNTELAYLTTKEHFIVHHLLVYMTTGTNQKRMIEAIMQFSQGRKLTAKQAEICMRFKHSPCSDHRRSSISKGRLNTKQQECQYCGKHVEPGNFKQFHGEMCKKNPNISITVLEERSKKKRESALKSIVNGTHKTGSPISDTPIICPHCNKMGYNEPNMKRWHFSRCKTLTVPQLVLL